MASHDEAYDRVLIFAPIGRDGSATTEVLRRAGLRSMACASLAELLSQIKAGAAAIFVAEEGFFGKDLTGLFDYVSEQPAWSDLPFIILTSQQEQPNTTGWRKSSSAASATFPSLNVPYSR